MPYTVIEALPKRKKYARLQRELHQFWTDDNAKCAIVDHSEYKSLKSCASSYHAAVGKMKIPVDVCMMDGEVYLIKKICDE